MSGESVATVTGGSSSERRPRTRRHARAALNQEAPLSHSEQDGRQRERTKESRSRTHNTVQHLMPPPSALTGTTGRGAALRCALFSSLLFSAQGSLIALIKDTQLCMRMGLTVQPDPHLNPNPNPSSTLCRWCECDYVWLNDSGARSWRRHPVFRRLHKSVAMHLVMVFGLVASHCLSFSGVAAASGPLTDPVHGGFYSVRSRGRSY